MEFQFERISKVAMTVISLSALTAAVALSAAPAGAAFEDEDDYPQAVLKSPADKARHKMYLGGRDEQDLEVQPALAQPSRQPDGSNAAPAEPAAHD